MLRKYPYAELKNLGVNVWLPRAPAEGVIPERIRVAARCLVLCHLPDDAVMSMEEQKIFTGMLSVLELPSEQIMQATIRVANVQPELIADAIQPWQPEFILQLSMDLPEMQWQNPKQNLVRTYSPAYLLHNPQYKSQAYKTLLALRAMLHGASKSNS